MLKSVLASVSNTQICRKQYHVIQISELFRGIFLKSPPLQVANLIQFNRINFVIIYNVVSFELYAMCLSNGVRKLEI